MNYYNIDEKTAKDKDNMYRSGTGRIANHKEDTHIVDEGNAFYEVDNQCIRRKRTMRGR